MTLWIDADACPKLIKEVVYKVSTRKKIPVILVANSFLSTPMVEHIRFVQVEHGADVADQYIVDHAVVGDLVITADIPLAGLLVEKQVMAINPRGEIYTEDTISERLSMRNFMQDLRDSGVSTGGPAPFGAKDKERFTNALEKILTQLGK